ncbi:CoA transferase, partial [Dehalococcoidia bacterium]|nr:CoA transferase [Dehalococcoidia bacterium]
MNGPLAGIKIVDVCQLAVGPWAGSLLGQLGADVVKIEDPKGDPIRNLQPSLNDVGTYYTTVNLNKRNIALDLKDPDDLSIALRLAERCDVFLENFRPGVMERLGLGYGALKDRNPQMIYCSVSGYGYEGPRRNEGGADGYIRSYTGFDSINGIPGSPERFRTRGHIDHTTSAVVDQTILAALIARQRYGIGQRVETTMMQATMLYQTTRIAEYFATGKSPEPMGSATTNLAPNQAFSTSDNHIAIGIDSDSDWALLCDVLGRPGLASAREFAQNSARVENRQALMDIIEPIIATRSSDEWLKALHEKNIPSGPYLTFPELWTHPQLQQNQMAVEIEHPWGNVKVGGSPWTFSETPVRISRAPGKNEHRAQILAELDQPPHRPKPHSGKVVAEPIEGIQVVELSQGLAGPFAAMQLGDLGAQVVKVEPPNGDWTRYVGPPFVNDEGPIFLALNRNKKGVVLDVTSKSDLARLKKLIADTDIFLTDLSPTQANVLELSYDDLQATNKRLIYCSVTPFGENGPLKDSSGSEVVLQAMSDVWRYLGALDQPPLRLGSDAAAMAAGIFSLQGILAALLHRGKV